MERTPNTIDFYPVTKGLKVWDYDLNPAVVGDPQENGHPSEPVWYSMTTLEGKRSSSMDAKRLWFRHPTTRKTVEETVTVKQAYIPGYEYCDLCGGYMPKRFLGHHMDTDTSWCGESE